VPIPVDQFAVLGAQPGDGRVLLALDGDAEHVDTPLVTSRLNRLAALAVEGRDGLESVPQVRCALEVLRFRGGFHLPPERIREDSGLALEEALDGGDVLRVALEVDLASAGRGTESHLVVQTRPLAARVLVIRAAPHAVRLRSAFTTVSTCVLLV